VFFNIFFGILCTHFQKEWVLGLCMTSLETKCILFMKRLARCTVCDNAGGGDQPFCYQIDSTMHSKHYLNFQQLPFSCVPE
jgi:hypothetical protein